MRLCADFILADACDNNTLYIIISTICNNKAYTQVWGFVLILFLQMLVIIATCISNLAMNFVHLCTHIGFYIIILNHYNMKIYYTSLLPSLWQALQYAFAM